MKAIKKEIKRLKKQLKTADVIIQASHQRCEENLENLYRCRGKLFYHENPLKELQDEQPTSLGINIGNITKAFNSLLKTAEQKVKLIETILIEQKSRIKHATEKRERLKGKINELKGILNEHD